jgi:Asp-tRNA(Asn)/Glu-tRNA(Gln) amidotransferase A subunit family amidase
MRRHAFLISYSGYVSWVGKYAERDASLVEILYEQGAVPFVRTNVPQTLMVPETSCVYVLSFS